jgi:uncharacterized delta-60 repeat protein
MLQLTMGYKMKKSLLIKILTMGFILLFVGISIFPRIIGATDNTPGVETIWVSRYDGPISYSDSAVALAVDSLGNVYVTGQSEGEPGDRDYATVTYNATGHPIWVRRYNESDDDEPSAMVVDADGNVYVTGSSGTIKYDTTGTQLWHNPGYCRDLAVDDFGNVYVAAHGYTPETHDDYLTIKYYANGTTAWTRTYNGSGNYNDNAWAIAVDTVGNVYVTGESRGIDSSNDYATVKYDTEGNEQWVQRYSGLGSHSDRAIDIAIDNTGDIYVTGSIYSPDTSHDFATIKYHPNGTMVWIQIYHGPDEPHNDRAKGMTLDPLGNVYVIGHSYGVGTENDYTTVKYDTDGTELWMRQYNGVGNADDYVYDIDVDALGNVYVTGQTKGTGPYYDTDYTTVKYDIMGTLLWEKSYNGPGNGSEWAKSIAVDDMYNVYVTGASSGDGTGIDFATIKYFQPFTRGDANNDGVIDLGDIVYLLNYLYRSGPAPHRVEAGDANSDSVINLGDVVYLVNYLFRGGSEP